MFTFNIPVPKLGITVPVTLPSEERLHVQAAHGVRQKVNDTLAGLKRSEYKTDEAFHDTGLMMISKVIAKIQAGTDGTRVAQAPTVASVKSAIQRMSAADLAEIKAMFDKLDLPESTADLAA